MQNLNYRLSATIAYGNHLQQIANLLKTPRSAPSKKSHNRRALLLYRALKKTSLKISWFSLSSFSIDPIPHTREGFRIRVDQVLVPGVITPVEYFLIIPHRSTITFTVPCCQVHELIKKLIKFKLLPAPEALSILQSLYPNN